MDEITKRRSAIRKQIRANQKIIDNRSWIISGDGYYDKIRTLKAELKGIAFAVKHLG